MHKWMNWQKEHHALDDPPAQHNLGQEYITANVKDEIQCVKQWLSKGNWQGHDRLCVWEGYIDRLENEYREYGLPPGQITSWINDPDYHKLMKVSGSQMVIDLPNLIKERVKKNIGDKIDIDWSTAEVFLGAQRPGDMWPLHRDKIQFKHYQGLTEKDESKIVRCLIMLDDQQPGQCFFMGHVPVNWKEGDVMTWPHDYYLPHGSANFGYHLRFALRITGTKTQ